MSEAKHTPGPWTWLNYPDGRKLLCAPNRAVIHCPDAAITVEPDDQRLIAAAPDLLAACEAVEAKYLELSRNFDSYSYMIPECFVAMAPVVRQANTAVGKAIGEPTESETSS